MIYFALCLLLFTGDRGVPVGSYDPVTDTLLWFNHTKVIFQGGLTLSVQGSAFDVKSPSLHWKLKMKNGLINT